MRGTWSDSLHTVLIEACSPATVAFTFDGRVLLELDLQIDFGFTNMYWVTQTIPDDGQTDLCL